MAQTEMVWKRFNKDLDFVRYARKIKPQDDEGRLRKKISQSDLLEDWSLVQKRD
jgi:hypothetical protein